MHQASSRQKAGLVGRALQQVGTQLADSEYSEQPDEIMIKSMRGYDICGLVCASAIIAM